jgi:hypothetical protein
MTRKGLAVLIVAGIAAGGMWACGGDSTSPGSIAGTTYNLWNVDGHGLPFIILQRGTESLWIVSRFIRLNSDGTYTDSGTFWRTRGGQVSTFTDTANGSWTQSGSTITFTESPSGDTFTGSLSGNTLTIIDDGMAFVFRK